MRMGAFDPSSNYPYNRTITFVHLGKTGGTSIRSALKVICRRLAEPDNPRKITRRVCSPHSATPDSRLPMVGRMIQDVFHMWGKNDTLLPLVSTYLVSVRHPVERIVSTYRYSHPANCLPEFQDLINLKPWGCTILNNQRLNRKDTTAYKLWKQCFPSPGIEDFAQALGSPWKDNSHFDKNLLDFQQWQCRQIARAIVRGSVRNQNSSPHMQYNYRYYTQPTLFAYPDKEVMVVRTEHQWEDLVGADVFVGGDGNYFRHQGKNISHGSSSYLPSPLSEEGYHKLCCILVEEIDLYFNILDRAVNLNPESRQESVQDLYKSCRISNWQTWQKTCRKKLKQDEEYIKQQINLSLLADPSKSDQSISF